MAIDPKDAQKAQDEINDIASKTGTVGKLVLQILKVFGIKMKKGPEVKPFE